ncbi:hypothetical protein ACJBU6_02597 [Exserohilum turcicum]
MAYDPVGQNPDRRSSVTDGFEPSTRYDAGSYSSGPPGTASLDGSSAEDGGAKGSKDAVQTTEIIKGDWPLQSKQLATMTVWGVIVLIFDVILASTPIMFVVLAIIAAKLNGEEVSDYGYKLKETLLLSPTIFPLLFAALMGRFFRHLGLWLAQRGTTLGRLEHLIGCQSVFSALERQFSLRSWSAIGVVSVLVWLLSPVGGQSALRLLDQETGQVHSTVLVRYLSPMSIVDSIMGGASFINEARSAFTSICLAAILSSSKFQNTPMDLWGNIKLPMYRHLENSTTVDGWKVISDPTADNITYASLIGIPIVGQPSDGSSTFNIKARQFDLTCSSNNGTKKEPADFENKFTWQLRVINDTAPACKNRTLCPLQQCQNYPCPIRSLSLATRSLDHSEEKYDFSTARCQLTYENFEAGVQCKGKACAVYKMRKLDLLDSNFTIGIDKLIRQTFVFNQLATMVNLDTYNVGSAVARGSTNMERWIQDPTDFIGVLFSYAKLWQLSPQVFGDRLTIMYNTFWQSTYGTPALAGNLPAYVLKTGQLNSTNAMSNIQFLPLEAQTTRATKPVYRTNWKWFTALLVCSLILLVAAWAALILKHITIAPDIIGYASSLTLLNPYCPTPTGGTTLNGLERAALLHDLPVRIGDVCPNESVGAIAFAKADMGQVARLDRQRWYI